MATHAYKQALPLWPTAILHGLFAAIGLAFLLNAIFLSATSQAAIVQLAAAIVLVTAATAGPVVLSYQFRGKAPPRMLIVGHGLLGAGGFLALAGAIYMLVFS
jgi:hypothetical protein